MPTEVLLKEEQFEALVEYYLLGCQEALDTFTYNVRQDTDFLDTEIPKKESICADFIQETKRCVDELQNLNAQVQ